MSEQPSERPRRSSTVGHPVLRERAREVTPDELRRAEMQAPDRRPDRHDARTPTAPGSPPTRSACRCGSPSIEVDDNPRYPYKPPIPLTVIVNPVIEPLDDETGRDQRGLPVGARPARRRSSATSTSACATSTATASRTTRSSAGLTAGTFQHEVDHLDGVLFLDRVADPRDASPRGSSSSASTAPRSSRGSPSSSTGSARDRRYWCELRLARRRRRSSRRAGRGRRRADRGRDAPASAPPPDGASRLAGLDAARASPTPTRHAFHRALRGRTHGGRAARSGPGASRCTRSPTARSRPLPARWRAATFAEMALAGITRVGEFHYLHHGRDGAPYADPNAMGEAVIAGRRARPACGSRCSTPATCTAGSASELERDAAALQRRRRRRVGDAGRRARRRRRPTVRIGAAIHCVRAVDPAAIAAVAAWATERGAPLHAHVSEQPAENERLPARPTAARRPSCSPRRARSSRALHRGPRHPPDRRATSALLGDAGATCCICPTTERDLADGIGPARGAARGRASRWRSAATRTR